MTVSATIAGLLPIMVGGMPSSTPLALLVVPVVYYLWQRASLAKGRR